MTDDYIASKQKELKHAEARERESHHYLNQLQQRYEELERENTILKAADYDRIELVKKQADHQRLVHEQQIEIDRLHQQILLLRQ